MSWGYISYKLEGFTFSLLSFITNGHFTNPYKKTEQSGGNCAIAGQNSPISDEILVQVGHVVSKNDEVNQGELTMTTISLEHSRVVFRRRN